ncbi:MAG TPA: peptidylprolyl isomerase [Methylophaga aminisulfidivorans]|uniref:Peptidylprolyl isomerase n=2 Tax=root TaxID=1 RepID=A0A7C1VS56_9GAMM|nr:peptidylprolyl isomerase [Methylophaga aminisulfidivorans]
MRFYFFVITLCVIGFLSACSNDDAEPESAKNTLSSGNVKTVKYDIDIRPILEKKCVACHGCFDAPCQLKMESSEGLLRGATPLNAYDGTREEAIAPTRLFTDADSLSEWRDKGFYSVLTSSSQQTSLLKKMLDLGRDNNFPANTKLPDSIDISLHRDNTCPIEEDFNDYKSSHPYGGMPFSVTGLTSEEYRLVTEWFAQGAHIHQSVPIVSEDEKSSISKWESYLNQDDDEHKLVSRWLFEHLYLAHLYFRTGVNHYYQLVRSYTPSGSPISLVKTTLPNGDANAPIYYRLRKIEGTIVHKRHITFLFDDALLNQIDDLFFSSEWTVQNLPGYDYIDRSNPFLTFTDIPAEARYEFMLQHAEYFTRTFMRGPVCRGQIATDVIRDNFWVLFQEPKFDLYIQSPAYRHEVNPLLGLPGQDDVLLDTKENWDKYKTDRNSYLEKRNHYYSEASPETASLNAIWNGNGDNTNALLSVFRHFDSASVRRGLIGQIPQTMWWMDYPLFERTYYELVVNFDLFGNVAHQLQTRLYFDLIRNGAEHNFLRLLPADKRQGVLDDWYKGMALIKAYFTYAALDTKTQTANVFKTDDVKNELINDILTRFRAINKDADDPLNRCTTTDCSRVKEDKWIEHADSIFNKLSNTPFQSSKGLKHLPELTFFRVKNGNERTIYSIIRNRYHTNVAFLLGDSLRYDDDKDSLTIYPGILGSYPNFIFDVDSQDLAEFQQQLINVDSDADFDALVVSWGIRRTHPQFWDILHDFTDWQYEHEPHEAGIFDVNRYQNL